MISQAVITRVCDWNAARYPREVNTDLQLSLLVEETKELIIAHAVEDEVETLDGCGDMAFVAIGGLWKHGFDPIDIEMLAHLILRASATGKWHVPAPSEQTLARFIEAEYRIESNLEILAMAYCYSFIPLEAVLSIVCDSNDTKVVERTDAGVKANIDKGALYLAPTAALKELVKQYDAMAEKHLLMEVNND